MELYQGSMGLDLKGLSAGLHGFTSLERFSLLYSGSAVDIYIYIHISGLHTGCLKDQVKAIRLKFTSYGHPRVNGYMLKAQGKGYVRVV